MQDSKKIHIFAPVKQNKGAIAQLVEQRTENPCVPGLILTPNQSTIATDSFDDTIKHSDYFSL